MNFLQGSSTIQPGRYVRVSWNDISAISGEIALMKSSSTYFSEVMEDYVQYGSPAQSRSHIAVNAGLWNDNTKFVASPGISLSIGLDANYYNSGEASNQGSWEEQAPTPSKQNICNNYLNLTSSINLGIYAALAIDYNGVSLTGSLIGLHYGNFVEFKPNSVVTNGTVLNAIKRACIN